MLEPSSIDRNTGDWCLVLINMLNRLELTAQIVTMIMMY